MQHQGKKKLETSLCNSATRKLSTVHLKTRHGLKHTARTVSCCQLQITIIAMIYSYTLSLQQTTDFTNLLQRAGSFL